MARIAVIGPGAIGGTMAAWLQKTGAHEVMLGARRPLPRLEVQTPGEVIEFVPTVWTRPEEARPVDWVLIATKAYDAEATARWLPGLTGPGTRVAVLQNGVEHRERFAPYFPGDRILPVVVELPGERVDPTHLRQRGPARLVIPAGALGEGFAALFAGTPVTLAPTPDFPSALWTKLCFNNAGILNGILLQAAGIMRDETVAEAARSLVRECAAVGRAEGAILGDDLPDTVVAKYRLQPPDSLNSLHADRLAGRPTEVDARNGVVIRLGRKHGIPTPCNQMAVALLQALTKPIA